MTFYEVILRSVNYNLIWKHFLHSQVTHYCGAPTVQVSLSNLVKNLCMRIPPIQIGIVNHSAAQNLTRPISAIIAGSAPTAQVIGQLERIGIKPVHVYGLTYVDFLDSQTNRQEY